MEKTVVFETYPEEMLCGGIYNPLYEHTIIEFEVPVEWVKKWLKEDGNLPFDEFMGEYTWDDTLRMYDHACHDGTIIFAGLNLR